MTKVKGKSHILQAKFVKINSEYKCNKSPLKQITKTIKNQIRSMSAVYDILVQVSSRF